MKKRFLLVSLLTIAICFCLISGATYALFTSESEVNITVSSGKVNVVAKVENVQTWSLEDDYAAAGRTDGTFTQGGSAVYADGTLTLDKLIPGDRVTFNIAGENSSNVSAQYRVVISCDQAYKLMEGIELTINGVTYTSFYSYQTAWATLPALTDMDDVEIAVELPMEAGNEFQDLTAKINLKVEAVQGNAGKNDPAEVVLFDFVSSEQELRAALSSLSKAIAAPATRAVLTTDLYVDADETILVPAGKNAVLDLNGHKIESTSSETGSNRNLIDVRGNLEVVNGTMLYKHTGANMAWGNSTNLFNVTAGGVLKLQNVVAKNQGGSDMAFVAHLNNWGEVTLVVDNCELFSTYCAIRVFNSGYDMNNVTITNSSILGSNMAFWVHNYTDVDFGSKYDEEAVNARLNFNFLNKDAVADEAHYATNLNAAANNIFVGKVRFGFTNGLVYYMAGNTQVVDSKTLDNAIADPNVTEVTLETDLTVGDKYSNGYGSTGLTITDKTLDGKGNTLEITGASGTWDSGIHLKSGAVKNLTINGPFRGISLTGLKGDAVIENVVIDDTCYTIHSDTGNKEYTVTVIDTVLNGWTSYNGFKLINFVDCKFGRGTGGYSYAYFRPYCATTLTNCQFEVGYDGLDARATVTLVNCYYGDILITAENVAELLGSANNIVVANN